MLPLTMLAASKMSGFLTANNALSQAVEHIAGQAGLNVAPLPTTQVFLSSAGPNIDDRDLSLSYPRVAIYATQVKNTQREKFRSFSGSVVVSADVWSSGNLIADAYQGLHIYVESICSILRSNMGDWGDGFRFSGVYEVQMQAPSTGGLGFVDSARINCSLELGIS